MVVGVSLVLVLVVVKMMVLGTSICSRCWVYMETLLIAIVVVRLVLDLVVVTMGILRFVVGVN